MKIMVEYEFSVGEVSYLINKAIGLGYSEDENVKYSVRDAVRYACKALIAANLGVGNGNTKG